MAETIASWFGLGGSVSMTHRARLLLAISLALGAAGILQPSPGLAAALLSTSLGLLAYILVSAYIVSIKASVIQGLRVERIVSEPLVEGREATVKLRIINRGLLALDNAVIRDSPPSLFEVEETPRTVALVPARGGVELVYRVRPVLGRHEWGPVRVESFDPLGLFRAGTRLGESTIVYVHPGIPAQPRRRVMASVIYQPGGYTTTRRRGVGVEFLELREYQPGDDMRLVEWKTYARTRRLAVKVFEQEGLMRLLLVLDESPTMFRGKPGYTPLEQGARLVTGLVAYGSLRGDVVRLVVLPARTRRIHYTGWLRGKKALVHATRLIAEKTQWPSTTYPRERGETIALYKRLLRLAPRGQAVILLVTDLGLGAEEAEEFYTGFYRLARSRGMPVLVAVPRPGPVPDPYWGAEHLELVEKQGLVVERLRGHGVPVIHAGLEAALREVARLVEYARLMGAWPRPGY